MENCDIVLTVALMQAATKSKGTHMNNQHAGHTHSKSKESSVYDKALVEVTVQYFCPFRYDHDSVLFRRNAVCRPLLANDIM